MDHCARCGWVDPAGTAGPEGLLVMAQHMTRRHGVPASLATQQVAQAALRTAKRRYGFPLDAGRGDA